MRNTAVVIGTILILSSVIPTVLAQVSTPLALAGGWSSKGSAEPSSPTYDTPSYMWPSPNTDPTQEKVYFNGFEATATQFVQTTFSGNFGFLGTAHRSTPHYNMAMLGTWLDCNKDGYIGFGDHGLLEYRSELLLTVAGGSPCAVHPFPTTATALPTHNDGTWVHEFIPIGYPLGLNPSDRNYYEDFGARAWVDGGEPGGPAGYVCFLSPVPTGTYHSVGSIGTYADCLGRGKINGDNPPGLLPLTGTRDLYDSTLAPIHNPWGEESDGSYVTAFDCSQPQSAHKGLTSSNNHETQGVGVSQPMVPTVHAPSGALYQNGDPSAAGTANETMTALDDCNRADNGGANGDNDGAVAHEPYSNEGSDVTNQDANPPVKIRNDPLYYQEAQRISGAQTQDGGTGVTSTQGIWTSFSVALFDNSFVDVFGPEVRHVGYITYYAVVPNATTALNLKLPGGTATGTYGAEACGTHNTGVWKSWQCDPALWNWGSSPHGVAIHQQDATKIYNDAMRVGKPYQLRDVDCFDESIKTLRDASISWGTPTSSLCV